ncbi:MAG: hypothetical protein ACJ73D_12150 [Pyrinomonadaceae bacterium]
MSQPVHVDQMSGGLFRHLLFEGILKMGGPFAVIMQVVGVFVLRDDGQSFGEYFAMPRTWVTFFLHATAFGLIMGFITWFRKEKAVQPVSEENVSKIDE